MKLYFIAILPDPGLRQRIKKIKEEVKELYNVKKAMKLPAHITLQIPFKFPEEEEERLISSLASFAEDQKAFSVNLTGFGSFPPRVIFLKVENEKPLQLLQERLQDVMKDFLLKDEDNKKKKAFHPHITVATRDLDKETFKKAWNEFKKRDFEATFCAKIMVLFRHDGKNWNLHKEFLLKQRF
ncbi:RNA 2',3'-cyclic phosphodiesterase [Salinimicrobium sp. GXAS 041]|uniref:RNA 2',3'-cyclic phosphodiesterase n=1 Tax=Salinimicrobium sp. GXAS 041 TaxID=3400806 RepID=UPI003C7487CA